MKKNQSKKTHNVEKALTKEDAASIEKLLKSIENLNRAPLETAIKLKKIAAEADKTIADEAAKTAKESKKKASKKEKKAPESMPLNLSAKIPEKIREDISLVSVKILDLLTHASVLVRDAKDEKSLEEIRLFAGRVMNRFTYLRSQMKKDEE